MSETAEVKAARLDVRAAMQAAIEYLSMDERGQGIRNMLTAALSSRAEEEVRADERERLANLAAQDGLRYERPLHGPDGELLGIDGPNDLAEWLRSPARSLTNGGE